MLLFSGSVEFASKELLDDVQFMTEAVKKNGLNLEMASKKVQDNDDVVKIAVQSPEPPSLKYVSERLRENRGIVKLAVETSGFALCETSPSLRNDRELAKIAIAHTEEMGQAFRCLSEELRDDHALAKAAVQIWARNFNAASERLKKDPEIIREALIEEPSATIWKQWGSLKYAEERAKLDMDFVISVADRAPGFFCKASADVSDNRDIMLAAVKQNSRVFECASDRLKEDKNFLPKDRLSRIL
jgi:hypothetical protein